ncbi:MAG: hypothetical protein KZQ89_00420 [Candidatus Thiodiazotropha sp. (ex Lucinoma kastoroae)]|nr:hypothetical protein [Candidatus Thiodiazotropha sp. (ex Lucinoma kastoroae)]
MSGSMLLNVLDIYLDSQNPRHEPIEDQEKIIAHLINKEKVKSLARDIAQYGLSPLESFAVVKDAADNYIAVEGNRRLCAATLLNDPELAPSSHVSYYKNLAKSS